MKYLDVLESYRKDYKISIADFVDGIMSTHSYYRYLKGETDLKVSQAIALLRKTDIDPEAFFSYASDILNPKITDLEALIDHVVNGIEPRLEKSYQKLMTHYTFLTHYTYQKPYKSHQIDNQHVLFRQAMDLLIMHVECQKGLRPIEAFKVLLASCDPYIITHQHHIYSVLTLSLMYHYDVSPLDIKTLMTLAMHEDFYQHYNWSISFIIFQLLTSRQVKIDETYEAYVFFTAKKLQGTLDIGFIDCVYYELCKIYAHKKDFDKMTYYGLRSFMTIKFKYDMTTQKQKIDALIQLGLRIEDLKQYIQKEMEHTLHERNKSI